MQLRRQWEGRRQLREWKRCDARFGRLFAQDDMSVANASGAAVRADVNANLQALVTNSSGASAPVTTWAYMWWADTTNGLLKIRNAANSAWVTIGTLASTNLGLAQIKSSISGMTYANGAVDAVNDLDIAAGSAMDAVGTYLITVAALTKQSDVAWAVGNNAGGLDTGAVGNSDYHIWAIARSDTGVTDYLYSLSATAPTMPTNYDKKRLIGWFKRVGGTIVAFKTYETEGGGLELRWVTPTLDVGLANTLTTTRRTDAVKVPLNFSVTALLRFIVYDASTAAQVLICCPDETDAAPSSSVSPLATFQTIAANTFGVELFIRTSAAGLIAARSGLASVDLYNVVTLGFIWARR